MNLTALQTALKRFGFDDTDPLTVWLNEAQYAMADEYDWPFFRRTLTPSTVAGSNQVAVTSSFQISRLNTVFIYDRDLSIVPADAALDRRRLDFIPIDTWYRDFDRPQITGRPTHYSHLNTDTSRTLFLYPTPLFIYSMQADVQVEPTELVNGGDVSIFPLNFHYSIALKAAAIGLQAESEEDRSANAEGLYQTRLASLKSKWGTSTSEAQTVQDVMDYETDYS